MSETVQIGEIEILKDRSYSLDAECQCLTRSSVLVLPGRYPLYRDAMTTYWVMTGRLNKRGPWRMGDGMFGLYDSDVPSELEVTFPSKRFGPDEWADLAAGPVFDEGDPDFRLRLHLFAEEATR